MHSHGFSYLGRRTGRDHSAACISATRAEVDDPVGGGDCVQIVLDQDDRVAGGNEPATYPLPMLPRPEYSPTSGSPWEDETNRQVLGYLQCISTLIAGARAEPRIEPES